MGQAQVTGKLRKALGHEPRRYARALEIGAGTGYFSLNLLRAGVIGEAVATDISPGMLGKLERSAAELELSVETAACEASELPFDDDSFDLVFGHAVLHHLPDLDAAFREFRRVLRPGGVVAFCGEPSHYGDRIAAWPKRGANAVAPLWRALMGAGAAAVERERKRRRERGGPARAGGGRARLHARGAVGARPGRRLRGGPRERRGAGREPVRLGEPHARGVRRPARRALGLARYAYRGYLLLQTLDRSLLEPRLPAALFYNLLLSARAPA